MIPFLHNLRRFKHLKRLSLGDIEDQCDQCGGRRNIMQAHGFDFAFGYFCPECRSGGMLIVQHKLTETIEENAKKEGMSPELAATVAAAMAEQMIFAFESWLNHQN